MIKIEIDIRIWMKNKEIVRHSNLGKLSSFLDAAARFPHSPFEYHKVAISSTSRLVAPPNLRLIFCDLLGRSYFLQ